MSKKQDKVVKEAEKPIIIDVGHGNRSTFSMLKISVDRDTINQIHLLESPFGHKRYIRKSKVGALTTLLMDGKHWRSPLILERINRGNEGFRIIDGAHRWYSLKNALDKMPKGSKISFYAGVYEFDNNMLEKDRKKLRCELFTTHNIGTVQSTADFISSRRDDIPMFDRIAGIKKKIPCTIYGAMLNKDGKKEKDPKFGDTLKFKNVVGDYFAGKKGKKYNGGYSGSGEQFIKDCRGEGGIKKPLSEESVKDMEYVWNIITLAYQLKVPYDFSSKDEFPTPLTKTTPMSALTRLILQNKHKFTQEEIISRLQRDTVKEAIKLHSKLGGREASKSCHDDLHYRLNKGYEDESSKRFLPIYTEEEQKEEELRVQEEYKKQEWREKKLDKIVEESIDEVELKKKKTDPTWKKYKGQYK